LPGDISQSNAWSRKLFLLAVNAGLLIAILLIAVDLKNYVSRVSAFNKIELNMPEDVAIRDLREYEIYCGSAPTSYRCTFDDFWRTYRITIVEPQRVVTRKEFAYKRQTNSVLFRALRWAYAKSIRS